MPFKKGQSGNPQGRKRGEPNKLNADIKAAIEAAFDRVGGADYLKRIAEKKPEVFCALLGKVLPTQLQHSGALEVTDRVDRPPRENREQWIARRNSELGIMGAPAGSAE